MACGAGLMLGESVFSGLSPGGNALIGGPPEAGEWGPRAAGGGGSYGPQKFHQIWCDLVRFVKSLCEADRNNIDWLKPPVEQALEPSSRGNWR